MRYKGRYLRIFCSFLAAFLLNFFGGCGDKPVVYDIQTESSQQTTQSVSESLTAEEASAELESSSSEIKSPDMLKVYICGAVNNPGVYELSEGDRICDLIVLAGGLRSDAEERLVNQAALLEDGMQITIYTKEESAKAGTDTAGLQIDVQTAGTDQAARKPADTKVNINTADKEELMTLNGIGETRADSILAYRMTHGRFDSVEAIMNVDGIKDKLFEKIRDEIEV